MRRATVGALVLVCSATVSLCAEPFDHSAFIRELLDSRLLDNAHFQVPVSLYQQYVRETFLPAEPPPAPVGAIAEHVDYHLSIPPEAKAKPLLKMTVRVRVFDPARAKLLPVFPPGPAWDNVTADERPGKLARTKGWLAWTPDQPGVHTLSAEAPLMDAAAEGTSLKLQPSKAVRASLRLDSPMPWQVWDNVQGHWGASGSAEAGTDLTLPVPPASLVTLSYRRPQPVTERPPRYELRGDIIWNLDAATQQVTARLDVAIAGRRTDRIDLILPPTARRVEVTGPDVREARPAPGGVSVFLRGKIRDQTRLRVTYELPSRAGAAASFGRLGVRDGHWASGCLVVANTAGGSEVVTESTSGLTELPPWAIPRSAAAMLPGPAAMAYEITGRDFSAAVDMVNLGEFALRESIADLAHFELMFRPDGSVLCKVRYEIRNRSRQFLKLTTPPGSLVLAARVNDKPVPLSAVAAESGAYRLPLVRSLGSVKGLVSFPVEVVLLWRAAALKAGRGQIELALPRVDIPIAYAWCQTYVPEGMKVRQWSGPLRSVEKYSSETATAYLGYGRGELAQGYDEKDRLKMVTAAAPRRQPWSEIRKPSTKPAKPKPTRRPPKPSLPTPTTPATGPKSAVRPGFPIMGEVTRPGQAQGQLAKPTGKMAISLARNYYRSGNEFYAKNDFSGAATAFNKVLELAPESSEAANSRRMLGNIKLARGELALRTKGEKAAAAQVRLAQREALRPAEERYRQSLQAARKSLAAGEHEQARAQLQVADALARQGGVASHPPPGGYGGGAPSDRDKRDMLRARLERAEQDKIQRLAKQYKRAKEAGKHAEALKAGRQLRASAAITGKSIAKTRGGRLSLEDVKLTEGTYAEDGSRDAPYSAALLAAALEGKAGPTILRDKDLDEELKELSLLAAKKRVLERVTRDIEAERRMSHLRRRRDGSLTVGQGGNLEYLDRLGELDTRAGARATLATAPAGSTVRPVDAPGMARAFTPADEKASRRLGLREEHKQLGDIRRAKAPGYELQKYPRDWKELTMRRGRAPEPGEAAEAKPDAVRETTTTRVYDVNDLVFTPPGFPKRSGEDLKSASATSTGPTTINSLKIDGASGLDLGGRTITLDSGGVLLAGGQVLGGDEFAWHDKIGGSRAKLGQEQLVKSVREVIESAGLPEAPRARLFNGQAETRVQILNGQLIVSGPGDIQAATGELLSELRKARGPQVEAGGERLAAQRARGIEVGSVLSGIQVDFAADLSSVTTRPFDPTLPPVDDRVRKFIEANYDWALTRPAADGGAAPLVEALGRNLRQKVVVNSTNLNVDAPTAGRLGIRFVKGRNNTSLAVVDEAQLRTLLELDARRAGVPAAAANVRFQETIVGTDALLANDMIANATFAADRSNTLNINANPIRLRHEQYVLINNGRFLTAVRAGPMQHWTETPADVRFAEVGEQIDVPAVGRLVKFEKTLVQPTDNLVIRANYQWKGDSK